MATLTKTTTYTPIATGVAPSYGTQGASVSALQTQLNTANKGVAGYVPLAVDGKYGPLTQAATQFKAPVTAPTIAQAYSLPTVQEDPALATARTAQADIYAKQAAGTPIVDEKSIRDSTLAQFQGEIDAVNALYANKLKEAQVLGGARLGSSDAIQARRGLLGSDFGAQQTGEVNKANQDVYNSIDAERANAVAVILSKGRQKADETIAERTRAISEGADSHLKYLSEAGTRKKTSASDAAKFIYDQKLSPKDLTPSQLSETAKNYGVSVDDLKNAYTEVKKTADEAAKKLAQDATKALPASAQEYEYAKSQGYKGTYNQYQTEDANRKALALKTPTVKGTVVSGGATFSPEQISKFGTTLEMSRGADRYVDPDVYLQAYEAWTAPDVGGLAKDFIAKYPPASYVNPVNNTLPKFLRSTKTEPKGREL